ncbi:MAG: UDP-N-acetylglucosamine 2-epimerase (hydrolyzing) [Lachnospiraceae bacterium]|nr:UDP-N-acetylglucosamine 2-epimerase (hydrolyzing) [Lachnospiraceae bacterium]
MTSIAVLTATRAEYGLLKPVIEELNKIKEVDVRVLVTGAHLSHHQGSTYKVIEEDGIEIAAKIEILTQGDKPSDISRRMSNAITGFAEYFEIETPDALLVLGDRYETLAVCIAAMNEGIPIIHLYGGETTEGAIDEAVRHAITKMSYLHLTSTEDYRRRVIQLGEAPERVFCVGALGVENAIKQELLSREELGESLNIDLNKGYAVVTYHPVTLEKNAIEAQVKALIEAMEEYNDLQYIITKANTDAGGIMVNKMLQDYADGRENVFMFSSLGMKKYLSAVKYAEFVLGNSSSGLIEVPAFGVPTVNIGDRQKGRMKGETVIDCQASRDSIIEAIRKVRDSRFRSKAAMAVSPYGDGETVNKIVEIILSEMCGRRVDVKKRFYDLDF